MNEFRYRLGTFIEDHRTQTAILLVIIFNAITLGLETSQTVTDATGNLIPVLNGLCLSVFVVELALKLYARGPVQFFTNGWMVFDFVIVAVSLIPGTGVFTELRALRVLRVLRLVSIAPSLQKVVESLIKALPGMGSVFLMMALIFYIGSVMATRLYGADFPDWFGTIGKAAYSLFQIMTLESWSMGIVRPVMKVHPYAWAFFVPFILITTFAVLNLLVGLIVNSMQETGDLEKTEDLEAYQKQVLKRLEAIEKRLSEK